MLNNQYFFSENSQATNGNNSWCYNDSDSTAKNNKLTQDIESYQGAHVWNIVRINDKVYLVDIMNPLNYDGRNVDSN